MINRDLLKFLFEDSQNEALLEGGLESLFEDLASVERLETKKQPLASALKSLGIETGELELVPSDGYQLKFVDHDTFAAAMNALSTADGVNSLAELGWVVANGGNDNGPGTMELPEYKIKFYEVQVAEPSNEKPGDLEQTQKHLIQTGMAGDVGNLKGEALEDLPDPSIVEDDKKKKSALQWPDASKVQPKVDPLTKVKVPSPKKFSFGVHPKA